jgi:Tfp pilus assembly protein PilV
VSAESCPPPPPSGGFTLIEVVGALLIFTMGVLMVLNLSSALTIQLDYSGTASEIVVVAHEQIDSLAAMPFDSLVAKTEALDFTVGAEEIEYTKTVTVSLVNPLLYRIDVDVSLRDTLSRGPSYAVSTYSAGSW